MNGYIADLKTLWYEKWDSSHYEFLLGLFRSSDSYVQ